MPVLIVLVPTPGLVATAFLKSMIGLSQVLPRHGVSFAIKTYEFSDIVVSRNYLMSYFLSQPQFTHALLLDCDLGFEPEQVLRLFRHGADFVAAPYPRRRLAVGRFHDLVLANAALPPEHRQSPETLAARSYGYVLQAGVAAGKNFVRRRRGDFVTAPGLGMGFSLISRAVPETMVARGVVHPLPRQGRLPEYRDAPHFHDFFGHSLSPDGTMMYGEDQSFCHRWIFGCDGDLWIDTKARVTHYGQTGFVGDYGAEPQPPTG